jgi:DNA-binding Lrp family transcriptional regulator
MGKGTPRRVDEFDAKILAALQGDLDDCPEPYARIAERLGLSEDEVIARIRRMQEAGIIRRIGAMIRHIEAGISHNGMIVWKVPDERVDELGALLASFPEVTHCYERPPFGKYGGTLFTMVHAASEEECMAVVEKIAQRIGVSEYEILFSKRELKKISMTYFEGEDASVEA